MLNIASWREPKTDWYGAVEGGVYVGDRFNNEDYNRIKNNLLYLHSVAMAIMPEFDIADMGEDKGKADHFFADEINTIEDNLEILIGETIKADYGDKPMYYANGKILDYKELNRIEGATLDMFNKLMNQYKGRRMFTFLLGDDSRGGF